VLGPKSMSGLHCWVPALMPGPRIMALTHMLGSCARLVHLSLACVRGPTLRALARTRIPRSIPGSYSFLQPTHVAWLYWDVYGWPRFIRKNKHEKIVINPSSSHGFVVRYVYVSFFLVM
jgi:hypothetical protein